MVVVLGFSGCFGVELVVFGAFVLLVVVLRWALDSRDDFFDDED